jgi:hypothetical protein
MEGEMMTTFETSMKASSSMASGTDGVFQFHGAISIITNHQNIIFKLLLIFNEINAQNFIF